MRALYISPFDGGGGHPRMDGVEEQTGKGEAPREKLEMGAQDS